MATSVFTVGRQKVEVEATLSDSRTASLIVVLPNTRQISKTVELSESGKIGDLLKYNINILKENITGEFAKEFIYDLMENGNADTFMQFISDEAKKAKKQK